MSSPKDFFMPTAPQSYAGPLIDFSKIQDEYYKSRAANAFAGGLPKDAKGQYDFPAIINQAVQAGGTAALPNAMELMKFQRQQQFIDEDKQQQGAAPAGGASAGGGPQTRVSTREAADDAAYIRQAAIARGMNPDVAVRVAASEGLFDYTGDQGSSFGPFQLHYGGMAPGGNAVGGLGDEFTKATGLHASDPATKKAQIDFALDHAAQNGWGAWHGWKGDQYAGISKQSRALGQSKAASADVAPQATKAAGGPANATDAAGSPAAITGQKTGGTATRQQTSTGPATQPETAVPQTVGAEGRSVPTTGKVETAQAQQPPAQPTQTPRANATLPPNYKGTPQQYIQEQENIFNEGTKRANSQALAGFPNQAILDRANKAHENAVETRKALEQDLSPTEAEKNLRGGTTQAQADIAREQKLGEARDIRFSKLSDEIEGSVQAGRKALSTANVAKGLFNDPETMSGIAHGAVHTLDQYKAWLTGGDPHKAAALDAVSKVSATQMLDQFVGLKNDIDQQTGQQGGRVFSAMVDTMHDATARAETTLEGARFLIEMQGRFHQLNIGIGKEARQYAKDHAVMVNGKLEPRLDQGWYEHLDDYLEKHNPFTDKEMSNPVRYLGAVEIPKHYDTMKQAQAWAQKMKLEPNEVVRFEGKYIPASMLLNASTK